MLPGERTQINKEILLEFSHSAQFCTRRKAYNQRQPLLCTFLLRINVKKKKNFSASSTTWAHTHHTRVLHNGSFVPIYYAEKIQATFSHTYICKYA
jgi:hypothetical protein